MNVITYARFSTDRQSEASIVDQQRVCHEFAGARGWTIAADFTDEGISGAAIGNRPGLLRALELVSAGDVLLVADLTRLSRSQDLAPLLDRLRYRGVRVIGVLDHFDSESPIARMQAGLSGLMSDELRAQIRVRTHLSLETRAKSAQPTGGKAYGYDSGGQIIEAEAEIVREVFQRYADGEALRAIASDLNARRIPSPGARWQRKARRNDGRWLISALHSMLGNERYTGRVVWNRSTWVKDPDTGRRVRRDRPQSEWIITSGPAIVGQERAQRRLNAGASLYGRRGPGGHPRYLLSGLLQCGYCGAKLIITGSNASHYYCATHRQGGDAACSMSVGVRRDVAEHVILQPIREELLSPAAVDRVLELVRAMFVAERRRQVRVTPASVAKIDEEIALYERLIEEDPSRAHALGAAIELLQARKAAEIRKSWRSATADGRVDDSTIERAYRDYVARMGDVLSGRDMDAAREALRSLLGDIRVDPHPSRQFLVATLRFNAVPLIRAAGIDWCGSGGLIWSRSIEFRRVA
jgi:site-specific DNA recombinase